MKQTFLLFFSLCFIFPLYSYQAKVTGVSDGDTIKVLKDNRQIKIRLYGIDTPEKRQDFGSKAKQFTSDMVSGKIVEVKQMDMDRYGRSVSLVYAGNSCLNEELVKAGYAWVYTRYCAEPYLSKWNAFQDQAKKSKLGLWAQSDPTPPWEFRHGKKKVVKANKVKEGIVYSGNYKSYIFHRPSCRYYDCKSCTVRFKSRQEAINKGYQPCKVCRP